MQKYHDPIPCDPQRECAEPFYLEAVIICDKYSDFLRHTLPLNKHIFDRVVVVTSYEDKETQRICEYHHVECIKTDVLESRKKVFCKGKGINVGLDVLSKRGWVAHIDADIVLPPQTRILLERAHLDPSMVYGIDRFNVRGAKVWNDFQSNPKLQHECDAYIHMSAFPVATRVMQASTNGYIPIGFFQLWNPKVSGYSRYIEGHTDAGREDMLFPAQWPRHKRGFIPELIGYHLESEDASMSMNWAGRVSAPFV